MNLEPCPAAAGLAGALLRGGGLAALAAALLWPPLSRAREGAAAAVCQNNLRQVYIGLMMYAADWDGWGVPGIVPSRGYARLDLQDGGIWARRYFGPGVARAGDGRGGFFWCPSDARGDKGLAGGHVYASYRFLFGPGNYVWEGRANHGNNGFFGWRSMSSAPAALPNLAFLERTVTYTRPDGTRSRRPTRSYGPAATVPVAADRYQPGRTHGVSAHGGTRGRGGRFNHLGRGGLNIVYADGRVAWVSDDKLRSRTRDHADSHNDAWW